MERNRGVRVSGQGIASLPRSAAVTAAESNVGESPHRNGCSDFGEIRLDEALGAPVRMTFDSYLARAELPPAAQLCFRHVPLFRRLCRVGGQPEEEERGEARESIPSVSSSPRAQPSSSSSTYSARWVKMHCFGISASLDLSSRTYLAFASMSFAYW